MRTAVCSFTGMALLLQVLWAQVGRPEGRPGIVVVVTTELGVLEIAVDSARAPATAGNFLRYVDGGFYDGGRFFRTVTRANQPGDIVKIEVIQCDINPLREKESFGPIALERTSATGLKHTSGTVSMARAEPNSATSSVFICIGNQPELDYGGKRNKDGQGFAAFGRVIRGMEVVRKIQRSPAEGQRLTPPIRIISVSRKQSRPAG
jgi:peptidyl-prolyl cis-trans isomerase A (cyclophilin A)